MHTSTILTPDDFRYRIDDGPVAFADLIPNYHYQDRIAIVAPDAITGFRSCSLAVLALTTTFYEHARSHRCDYFDYPQHFAMLDPCQIADWDATVSAWGWIDVWPDASWLRVAGNKGAIMREVYERQVNRLFWPAALTEGREMPLLPDYAWQIIGNRLKSVHYYGDGISGATVTGTKSAVKIASEGLAIFPHTDTGEAGREHHSFLPVPVDQFLEDHKRYFAV